MTQRHERSLLCVCNFPTNTGYAWNFIEGLYAEIARRIAARGLRTFVAYPKFEGAPRTLEGSPAIPIELDATLRTKQSLRDTVAFIRRERVEVMYLTDRPARSHRYATLRLNGLKHLLVHDHASGVRSVPKGFRRGIKWALARLPLIVADDIVAVSDYVARRQVEVGQVPARRVTRVWNGIPIPPLPAPGDRSLHAAVGVSPDRPIVGSASRAAAEKGIPTLLRAFDLLMRRGRPGPRPVLVYMGDGPEFGEIQQTREALASRDDIILTGYRPDAGSLLGSATVCVVPSLWQDALPLATMQPMALARPVVASAVGGIPEMVVDGKTGLLVPAGDEARLADAIGRLLADPAYAAELGRAARARIAELFTPAQQLDTLTAIVERGFGLRGGPEASEVRASSHRAEPAG